MNRGLCASHTHMGPCVHPVHHCVCAVYSIGPVYITTLCQCLCCLQHWASVYYNPMSVSVLFTALDLCILQPCVSVCAVYNIGPVYITTLCQCLCCLQHWACIYYNNIGPVYITTLCLCLCCVQHWACVCYNHMSVSVLFTTLGLYILEPYVCVCAVYSIGPVYATTTLGLCILQ